MTAIQKHHFQQPSGNWIAYFCRKLKITFPGLQNFSQHIV